MSAPAKKNGLLEDRTPSVRGAVVFVIAAAFGSGSIVTGKLLGLSQVQITALPLAVMAAYAVLMFTPKFQLRNDNSGDNLYYLGFLFTLTSISAALYSFADDDGNTQIVSNFGIAIATTIAGLVLRIMFNQLRVDPAEVERSSRLELAEAARRMRRELDDAAMELSVFRKSAIQSASDFAKLMQEAFTEDYKKKLMDGGGQAEEFQKKLNKAREGLLASLGSMAEDGKTMAEGVKDLSKQLQKLKTPDKVLEMNFQPTFQTLQTLLEEFRSSQANHSDQLANTLNSFDGSNKQLLVHLTEIQQWLQNLTELTKHRRRTLLPRTDHGDFDEEKKRWFPWSRSRDV